MNSILNLIRRRRMKIEVPEEIESHIQERTDELVEAGIPERQARQQATREFGNPLLYLEVSRDSWGWTWLDRLSQDLRYGVTDEPQPHIYFVGRFGTSTGHWR